MAHWSEAYIGRPWTKGQYDCADLAAEVLRTQFGKTVQFPSDHGSNAYEWTGLISDVMHKYVERTEQPVEGDGVLMVVRGKLFHIGVLCVVNDEQWVLHNCYGVGTRLTRLREIGKYGFQLEGFYRWK